MSFEGLSAGAIALGLAGLTAALFALHLLRVRLRRVRVDSLLLFRALGDVHRPRVLPGRPARWGAFLLALALGALLWATFAGPRATGRGPSRAIVIDLSASARAITADGHPRRDVMLATAARLTDEFGLGTHGSVVAAAPTPRLLLLAGEPSALLTERGQQVTAAGGPDTIWSALRLAATGLGPEDEILVLGGPESLPVAFDGVPIRRGVTVGSATGPDLVSIALLDGVTRSLRIEAAGGVVWSIDPPGRTAVPIDAAPGATGFALLGPLVESGGEVTLRSTLDGQPGAVIALAVPPRPRVHVATVAVETADAGSAAVDLTLAADPWLQRAEPAAADVLVAVDDAITDRPTLRLVTTGPIADRVPQVCTECPVPVSFLDHARAAMTALDPRAGETVWIEDAVSGSPLVAANARADGALELRIATWLLDDLGDRDVPQLLAGGLRLLGGAAARGPHAAGSPMREAVAVATPVANHSKVATVHSLPTGGQLRLRMLPGAWQIDPDDSGSSWRALPTSAPAIAVAESTVGAVLDGPLPWAWLLLIAALALGAADVWLHQRGRIP